MIKSLFLKLKRNISNILSQSVDERIWDINEHSDKLEILHFSNHEDQIFDYHKKDFLNNLLNNFPDQHKFIYHIFSSYIYQLNDSIIEPTYGWIILDRFSVFKFSFPLVGDPWRPKPIKPSFIKFIKGDKKKIHLDEAISVRYGWENYYHFFIDILGQLTLLEEKGIPKTIPIVVPHYFSDIPFVQEFLKISSYIKREIIIQKKNEFIHVKKLIVAKNSFSSGAVSEVINSIDHFRNLNREDKFFIYRSKNHGRSITNNQEIIEIAQKYGFTPIDSSKSSLVEQISLFSGASQIVGVHGAGLTNIFFRKGRSLNLLEIFPDESLTPDHYKRLSMNLGFDYDSMTGTKVDNRNNFYLQPEQFENKIRKFSEIE